jgi:ferredoxin
MTLQIVEPKQSAAVPSESHRDVRSVPVAIVSYTSHGNVLVVGGAAPARARAAARALSDTLHVTLLDPTVSTRDGEVAGWSGEIESLDGYLGEFTARIANLRVEGVAPVQSRDARFDLILDFSATPLFRRRHPPQGYFHAPESESALARVLDEMRQAVGEFEKPRFFSYRENLCAHQRSEIVGCNACIDVCSTEAIRADADHVKVDPHLCMGCGACSTVCPSGAMSYQFPPVSDRGDALKRALREHRDTGASDACLVFHDGSAGREMLAAAGALPPRAVAIESWHVASIGLDLLLPAIAFGASQVVVVVSPAEDREYVRALREQMAIGETVLEALGYSGAHFVLMEPSSGESLGSSLASLQPAATVNVPATFLLSNDKRTAIEFAVEHLLKQARTPVGEIPLPAGAPFGEVLVDKAACTMCMSCVGACPASALLDGVDQPLLKFIERNCVQCGLCEETCPENAITLRPRLLVTPAAREARLLNETQPFHCVSCNKPFGTRQMVDAMLGRLAGHSMFSRPGALRRLQMCSDCRVIDMMSNKDEVSVLTLGDPNR